MATYNFGNLSWSDFQSVVADVLGMREGVLFEQFGPGADGGIDLRHYDSPLELTVVQCKHYPRSRGGEIVQALKKEVTKVEALKPRKYIVATSGQLRPENKDQIIQMFAPYIRRPSDVLGVDEIEALIRQSEDIERRHVKLWLNSVTVLEAVLHRDILNRTSALLERIQSSLPLYVPNKSFHRTLKILDEQHVCVVLGAAGVGKTMLADVLLARYIGSGWEPVYISSDIDEADRLWRDDTNQIFYYDDFLGQVTAAEMLGKNEDRSLVDFMELVARRNNKRLILTTRDYVLAQAQDRYERLSDTDLNPYSCTIYLTDYTRSIRARILYSHLYFADLPGESLRQFVESKSWHAVIDHQNYNPRVIQQVVKSWEARTRTDETLRESFVWQLNDPTRLWSRIYENDLSIGSRCLLTTLASLTDQVLLDDVREAWANRMPASVAGLNVSVGFEHALRQIEPTFCRVIMEEGAKCLAFANPSVKDWMLSVIGSYPSEVESLISNAPFFEQIELLWRYGSYPSRGRGLSDGQDLASAAAIKRFMQLNPDIVIGSLKRTLRAKSCSLISYWSGREGYKSRSSIDTTNRLRFVMDVVVDLGDDGLKAWLQAEVQRQISDSGLSLIPWNFLQLLDAMDRTFDQDIGTEIKVAIKNWLMPIEGHVNAYDMLAEFILKAPELFSNDDIERMKPGFHRFVTAESEVDDDGPYDVGHLEYALKVIKKLATGLGVDVYEECEFMQDRIAQIEAEFDDLDPRLMMEESYEEDEDEDDISDEDIDRIFISLLDRD